MGPLVCGSLSYEISSLWVSRLRDHLFVGLLVIGPLVCGSLDYGTLFVSLSVMGPLVWRSLSYGTSSLWVSSLWDN